MPADTISIAIPPELRNLIAQAADERNTTQDIAATTMLQAQITRAEAAQGSGELLAERYLSHPDSPRYLPAGGPRCISTAKQTSAQLH